MKIVIDISEEIYDFVQNTSFVEDESTLFKQTNSERRKTLALFDIIDAIRSGTPLPEQQSCEDCISRKDLLEKFTEECTSECACCMYVRDGYSCGLIEDAPSVTPQRPKGKWKPLNYKDEMWGYVYKCSNCGHIDYENDYCPKCGARMESDKE